MTEFSVPPSLERVVCCSKECSAAHRYAKRTRTCPQCSTEFQTPVASKKVYCSRECGQTSRRGRPHTNNRQYEKTCPVCENTFKVSPSLDHVVCCSQQCSRKRLAGQPREFTPESYAKLTGRPKKSADVERLCPLCGTGFTVPEWNPKVYCSTECSYEGRKGRTSPLAQKIRKECPVCGQVFSVSPSLDRVVCCSTACAGLLKRGTAMESVRTMTDADCAWFAGLFDGEGSIILTQRRRVSGGSVKITITNTNHEILERVREVTGMGVIRENPKRAAHHLDQWTWEVASAANLEILRQVRPWLIVKADRADAAIAGESFPRQSRWDSIYPESAGSVVEE